MERKRVGHDDARHAQRAVEKDLLTGVILAIVIPVLAFLLARALDLAGWGEGPPKLKIERPPVSIAHARDMLLELKRLYDENYRAVFVPRVERAKSAGGTEEHSREFKCADSVFTECRKIMARLGEERARPDNELGPVLADIQRWEQELAQAAARHDELNPVPAHMRR
ncbi:MAG TPA: hypothetical protein DCM87_12540 [Planctomycetes bacterium]|nr:hypothetical protein [Planctomycetota bacterium]